LFVWLWGGLDARPLLAPDPLYLESLADRSAKTIVEDRLVFNRLELILTDLFDNRLNQLIIYMKVFNAFVKNPKLKWDSLLEIRREQSSDGLYVWLNSSLTHNRLLSEPKHTFTPFIAFIIGFDFY
jgi:hypothetical protein